MMIQERGIEAWRVVDRGEGIERRLSGSMVQVVEAAAVAAARLMGHGDRHAADQAATEAMRTTLNRMNLEGTIVIGEGERDEAPMLYIGEQVGLQQPDSDKIDIAVDPLEGTNLTATGNANSIAVIAASTPGGLTHAPDTYMDKLIVGPAAKGKMDIDAPVKSNLAILALSLNREIADLTIVILDRPRHQQLIEDVRAAGARIRLIGDGDVTAAISAAVRGTAVHAVMGIGGAPEGVLAAAAMKCLGGEIQGRFKPRNEDEAERCRQMGIDLDKVYFTADLAPGEEIIFAATGVTEGDILRGVRFYGAGVRTYSLVMTHKSGLVRFTDSVHLIDRSHAVQLER